MMRREWGTFHLVPSAWNADADDADVYVLETHRHGPSHLELAIELLRLAGDEKGSERVSAAFYRARERARSVMDGHDIAEVLDGIKGLEETVESTLVDADGLIPQHRIDDLRARSTLLDLAPSRGALAAYAVMEALPRITMLRAVLQDAHNRGLHVAMD